VPILHPYLGTDLLTYLGQARGTLPSWSCNATRSGEWLLQLRRDGCSLATPQLGAANAIGARLDYTFCPELLAEVRIIALYHWDYLASVGG
jgi:hypothetical protein